MERKDDQALANVVDQLWKVTDNYWKDLIEKNGRLAAFEIGRPAYEFLRKNSKYKKYERTRERDTFLFMMNCASRPTLDGRFVNELVGTKRTATGTPVTVIMPPAREGEELDDHEDVQANKEPTQLVSSGYEDVSEEDSSPQRKVICRDEEDEAIMRDTSRSDRFSHDGSGEEDDEELREKALKSLSKATEHGSDKQSVFNRLGKKERRQ